MTLLTRCVLYNFIYILNLSIEIIAQLISCEVICHTDKASVFVLLSCAKALEKGSKKYISRSLQIFLAKAITASIQRSYFFVTVTDV